MSVTVNLSVNGKQVSRTCPAQTTLVELLREHLSLTGTHVGCDTTQCGACT
jgi:aerobic carbon-monoxide dehydrogenase small subunit